MTATSFVLLSLFCFSLGFCCGVYVNYRTKSSAIVVNTERNQDKAETFVVQNHKAVRPDNKKAKQYASPQVRSEMEAAVYKGRRPMP